MDSSEDEEIRQFKKELEEVDFEVEAEVVSSLKYQYDVRAEPNDGNLRSIVGSSQSCANEPVSLDNLSSTELKAILGQVKQALYLNQLLITEVLKQEVRLTSIKRQRATEKKRQHKVNKDDLKVTDAGRYYVQFKAPYFKNSDDYAGYVVVPDELLPFSAHRFETMATQWTRIDLKELEARVRVELANLCFKQMMKDRKPTTTQAKQRIIDRYNFLRKSADMSLLLKIGDIDFYSVSSRMKKNHSPNECKKAWNLFLKPEINKKKWSADEREKLGKVMLKHNYEDWDAIANELGTNRNAYQCFHHYVDKILKISEGDWTEAEEQFLIHLVNECTYGHRVLWHKVAYFFETRTITQIYRKWTLSCVGKDITAGTFTEEDDKMIMDLLVFKKGNLNVVARKMNRIPAQVRSRLAQLKFSMTRKYGEWTLEEDKQLMELVDKYGKKNWALIAQHLLTRSRIQIRHRYNNILKALKRTPNLTLETMDRPKRTVYKDRKLKNLRYAVKAAGVKVEEGDDVDTSVGRLVLYKDEFRDDETIFRSTKSRSSSSRGNKDDDDSDVSDKPVKSKKALEPLSKAITDYYMFSTRYSGEPRKAIRMRSKHELETVNSLLNFTPYKHFDVNNAEWARDADETDPHFKELLSSIRNKTIEGSSSKNMDILMPPCVSTFQGFYNMLMDVGYQNEHETVTAEELDAELKQLYCSADDETVAAVNKWNHRMKMLFSWPAALSEIELQNQEEPEAEENRRCAVDAERQENPEECSKPPNENTLLLHPGGSSEESTGVIFLMPEPPDDDFQGEAFDPLDISSVDLPDNDRPR